MRNKFIYCSSGIGAFYHVCKPIRMHHFFCSSDFVRVSRQLFRMQLEDRSVSPMPFTTSDIHSFLQPPAFKPVSIFSVLDHSCLFIFSCQDMLSIAI